MRFQDVLILRKDFFSSEWEVKEILENFSFIPSKLYVTEKRLLTTLLVLKCVGVFPDPIATVM